MRITVEFDAPSVPSVDFERMDGGALWLRLVNSQGCGFVDSGRLLQLLAQAIVDPDRDADAAPEIINVPLDAPEPRIS